MRDRFMVIYQTALDLLEAKRTRRATVLLEEIGIMKPPRNGEDHNFYLKIVHLMDTLRPEGSEVWACHLSPDGFCRCLEGSSSCMYCDVLVERN